MPTLVPCPAPILRFTDNAGNPAVGGTVLTQVGGVNYPTYQDVNGNTALPNPIPLNSRGEVSTAAGVSAQCFLEPGVAYTFTLSDAAGNQLWQATYVAGAQVSLYGGVDTGAANAYVLANVPNIPALQNGYVLYWIPSHSNTGASTINVNGLGAVAIVNVDGTALNSGQIVSGEPAQILYYGGSWMLLNAAAGVTSGSFVGQLGGVNVTVKYTMIGGKIVSLTIPPTTGNFSNPGLTLVGVPANLTPTTAKDIPATVYWLDAGAQVTVPIYLSLPSWDFFKYTGDPWTGGANSGPSQGLSLTYSLD